MWTAADRAAASPALLAPPGRSKVLLLGGASRPSLLGSAGSALAYISMRMKLLKKRMKTPLKISKDH